MSYDEKVANNMSNYDTTSNFRWYNKRFYSEHYEEVILGMPQLPKELPVSALDKKYTVQTEDSGRLDIITKKFYGEDYKNLMWVIMLYNRIRNPYTSFEAGTELYIPDRSTIDGRLI